MYASRDMSVMGPDPTSSNGLNPPQFITNVTKKVQYRDALETGADIIRSFAKAYYKAAARLDIMGLIIYLACDDETKAKNRAEVSENRLSLKTTTEDPRE